MLREHVSRLTLAVSKSVPTFDPSASQRETFTVAECTGDGPKVEPRQLKVVLEVEHCTAHRPTAILQGKAETYVETTERLDAAVSTFAASVGCKYELRVNPLLKVAKAPRSTPDTPTAKLLAARQRAGSFASLVETTDASGRSTSSGYPRIGAFEVLFAIEVCDTGQRIDTGTLYSKLHSLQWPNTAQLVKALSARVVNARLPAPPPQAPLAASPNRAQRRRPASATRLGRRASSSPAPRSSTPEPPKPELHVHFPETPSQRPTSASASVTSGSRAVRPRAAPSSPPSRSSAQGSSSVRRSSQNIWAVFEAFDKAELTKAVRVAGLPEGRKQDMVKSLVGAFQHSPKQVEVVVLDKPKRRKRILPNA